MRRSLYSIAILAVAGTAVAYTLSRNGEESVSYRFAQVERGARIYAENCAACHGAELEGQPNWRTQLSTGGLPAPPHDETGHTWHHADGILFIYTKLGANEGLGIEGFQSNMPAFRDTLSDADIWASLGYIMSRWPERVRQRQDHINEQSK